MNRGERRKRSYNKYIHRLKYWTRLLGKNAIQISRSRWRYADSYRELIGRHPWNFCKTTNSPACNRLWKYYERKRGKKKAYKLMLDTLSDTDIPINYKPR